MKFSGPYLFFLTILIVVLLFSIISSSRNQEGLSNINTITKSPSTEPISCDIANNVTDISTIIIDSPLIQHINNLSQKLEKRRNCVIDINTKNKIDKMIMSLSMPISKLSLELVHLASKNAKLWIN